MGRLIDEDDVIKMLDKGWRNHVYPNIACVHALPSAQPKLIKIDLANYTKEAWERIKKDWANVAATIIPAQLECEDGKGCSNCIYSGRPTYKSPCSECRDNSQWKMKQFEPCEDVIGVNLHVAKISKHCSDFSDLDEAEPCEDAISRAEAQTALQFAARRYTVAHEAHGEGRVVWSDHLISVPDAMNALREVPSVTPKIPECEDAVSRADVINSLCDWICATGERCVSTCKCVKRIKELPSLTPKKRMGKWLLAEDGWYCSACELYPPFDCDPEEKGIPYCPWCGAKMEGAEQE